jgi:hypothetical protein
MGKDQKILKSFFRIKACFFLLRSEASPSLKELKDVATYHNLSWGKDHKNLQV